MQNHTKNTWIAVYNLFWDFKLYFVIHRANERERELLFSFVPTLFAWCKKVWLSKVFRFQDQVKIDEIASQKLVSSPIVSQTEKDLFYFRGHRIVAFFISFRSLFGISCILRRVQIFTLVPHKTIRQCDASCLMHVVKNDNFPFSLFISWWRQIFWRFFSDHIIKDH